MRVGGLPRPGSGQRAGGDQHLEAALADYHAQRDYLLLPTYERVTRGRPTGLSLDEYRAFLVAVSPREFFSPAHVGAVLAERRQGQLVA